MKRIVLLQFRFFLIFLDRAEQKVQPLHSFNTLSMNKAFSRKWSLAVLIGISIAVILFGVWFLTRTYVIAAYNIPTRSMEKSIHLGGKVLVNKLNYLPILRGDILVFHFPEGDTVIDLPDYQSMRPYYDVIREMGHGNPDAGRQIVLADPNAYPLTIRPVYKRENYLKRCIAIPGDTLEMRDELVYIDGRPHAWPQEAETYFQSSRVASPSTKRI
ncbi:S26 family signal peptidase [Flavitalea flava]